MIKALITIIVALLISSNCHSTFYPMIDRNEACVKPQPAKIYSWHVHLLFFQLNEGNMAGALEIKSQFEKEFKNILVDHECPSLDHQDYNCMFELEDYPAGPFPTAQWAVYFLPEYFNQIVPWMMQHRGEYQFLVHPNTGCDLEDHDNWAVFGGAPWQLNMGAFNSEAPYEKPPYLQDKEKLKKHQDQAIENSELVRDFLSKRHD